LAYIYTSLYGKKEPTIRPVCLGKRRRLQKIEQCHEIVYIQKKQAF